MVVPSYHGLGWRFLYCVRTTRRIDGQPMEGTTVVVVLLHINNSDPPSLASTPFPYPSCSGTGRWRARDAGNCGGDCGEESGWGVGVGVGGWAPLPSQRGGGGAPHRGEGGCGEKGG